MTSSYQMWLTHDGDSDKIQFPVPPVEFTLNNGSSNKKVTVAGLGEVILRQDRPALSVSFSTFFPAATFPGVQVARLYDPLVYWEKIQYWKTDLKPSHFLITGTSVNMYCTIEAFPQQHKGGDVGTIYFKMTLNEYREPLVRQVQITSSMRKATIPPPTALGSGRTDNRSLTGGTYTVVAGDSLYKIALRLYGSGSEYLTIYNANKDKISNPNLIYPGQVLVIP